MQMNFFKKPTDNNDFDSPTTVIGKDIFIEAARITGNESVRIDGRVKGNVEINGPLVLGDTGSVTGDIRAKVFIIAGEVNGNVQCETQLHIASSSKITGDVQAESLVVDEGAQVMGRYIITGAKNAPVALLTDRFGEE
jgi:cytoskeletal protein CcmA (bactofilin family)